MGYLSSAIELIANEKVEAGVFLMGVKFAIGFGLGAILFSALLLSVVASIPWLSIHVVRLRERSKTISSRGFILVGANEQEPPVILNFHWRWKRLNAADGSRREKHEP